MVHDHCLLSEQVITAIIAAPAHVAQACMGRIEPDDFPDWKYRTVFEALTQCEFAGHQEPGSLIIQINRHLLASGHYKDVADDGLRQAVQDLASVTGHPEQLPLFISDLLERRFRGAVGEFSLSVATHAKGSPLVDVDDSLRQISELRRLRARIDQAQTAPALKAVREGGAA